MSGRAREKAARHVRPEHTAQKYCWAVRAYGTVMGTQTHTLTHSHTDTLGDPKPPDQVYTNMLFKHRHTNTQIQTQIDTQTQENKR